MWNNCKKITYSGLVCLTILSVLDFILTTTLVINFGIDVEANPLVREAMKLTNSVLGMLVVKIIAVTTAWIVGFVVLHKGTYNNIKLLCCGLWGVNIFMTGVVVYSSYLVLSFT